MSKLEQLFGAVFQGPPTTKANSNASQWAGLTTLNSGSTTAVVSTTNVKSNSIITYGVKASTVAASGMALRPIEIVSLSSGNYFTFGSADGIAVAQSIQIMWNIYKTD